ncbi:MAG: C25 family cysteine peptidase, partial [Acidobacteriota bacterium]
LDGWDQKLSVQSNKIGGASSTYRYTCTPGPTCTASGHSYKITGGGNGWAYGAIRLRDVLGPTLARLNDFTATRLANGQVALRWNTGYEVDNLGFNIYREQNGIRSLANKQIIAGSAFSAGQGVPLTAGKPYYWIDQSASEDEAVYWLEDIDLAGASTWNGPFFAERGSDSDDKVLPRRRYSQALSAVGAQEDQTETTHEVEPKASLPKVKAAPVLATSSKQSSIKLGIKQTGWHRITQPELVAAGLSPAANPRLLQLFVDGKQQRIEVKGEEDGRFDSTDSIEFYGVGLDTPSTDTRIYWLIQGSQPGLRIGKTVFSQGATFGDSFPHTVERRDKTVYYFALRNGDEENFFGSAITPAQTDQTISLRNIKLSAGEDALIEVSVQGVTTLAHSVRVLLNGSWIHTLNFEGQTKAQARINVPHSMLAEGSNTVSLQSQNGWSDVSLLAYIRATYQRAFRAEGDYLRFTARSGQQVSIEGFSQNQIKVVDVTDPSNPVEVDSLVSQGQDGFTVTATASGAGERRLLALRRGSALSAASIRLDQPSNLKSRSRKPDFIIITHRDFAASLAPLVSLRQSQGLSVEVVDVEDIYDEFSYGQKTPLSVRSFLAYSKTNSAKAPRFVMFVGDASYDPRNYLGRGSSDFVPTKLVDTLYLETASDDWLADFNEDGVADMAVGRLPVKTALEASLMVSKIVGYQSSSPSTKATIVADKNDRFNFEQASNDLSALMKGITVGQIHRDKTDDATARANLLAALNSGQKVVNYVGHGTTVGWKAGLLTGADAASLTNRDRLSLLVSMTCLNGYYIDPGYDSLSESMMKSQGGAVASWASSALTTPDIQAQMNQELMRQLFSATVLTIGEATLKAKSAVSDLDVRRSWILLGDPTTRLK